MVSAESEPAAFRGAGDRVAAFGALLALAGCLAQPLAVFRANRIVSGIPYGTPAAGFAGWLLLAMLVLAVAAAFLRPAALRSRALPWATAASTVVLLWALGAAAVALLAGQPEAARVSIGGGAWLAGAGCAVLWFASNSYPAATRTRLIAATATLAGSATVAVFGGLARLSIVTEYLAQSGTFRSALLTHVSLAAGSLAIAVVVGVPLGVLSLRYRRLRAVVLGVVGVIQTVPSLALLGLLVVPLSLLGLPGIGALPGTIALTLYALLPIVRNTYVGLSEVDPAIVDAGRGMGMSESQVLVRVQAPLALPLVVEGVRSAAVLVIGIAAVVAFIGVGTLGVLVFEGWGQQADDLILLGAVPMVVLAVVSDAALRALARALTSPGL